MARPTIQQGIAFKVRDRKIFLMISKGYPLPYVSSVFNLSKGRLTQIYKAYIEREDKYVAQYMVTSAIKYSQLVPQSCEVCGDKKSEGHHHKGYKQEYWLDVKWLCEKHHKEIHNPQNNGFKRSNGSKKPNG